jgi:tRNA(Ile)-lysidine synthase TilS/MesJ
MAELERIDLTNFTENAIKNLLVKNGFPYHEKNIDFSHKGFTNSEAYYRNRQHEIVGDKKEEMLEQMKQMLEYAQGIPEVYDDVDVDLNLESLDAGQKSRKVIDEQVKKDKDLGNKIPVEEALEGIEKEKQQKKKENYLEELERLARQSRAKDNQGKEEDNELDL